MNVENVRDLLEANKNYRGIRHWEKTGIQLSSYGLGLTQLKKLAKKVGKNHDLALELWEQDNYDMIILSTMVDEAQKINREQVERQVNGLGFWMIANAYCSNLMPKVKFQKELAEEWLNEKDNIKRRIAYLLIYNIARDDKQLGDSYFYPIIDKIKDSLQEEENFVKDAMNNALIMIGSRSIQLNLKAFSAAKHIGNVDIDYGDNSCQALDAIKHLKSKQTQKKIGA
jgi:3-methyladenine DNA glycosylase AlkD